MTPMWAWFGNDEPNYAYMPDGKQLLSELAAASPVPVFFRTHNLLTTGDGTPALKWGSTNAYTEDANGRPVYDWTIVDRTSGLTGTVNDYTAVGAHVGLALRF